MELVTERLILREFTAGDFPALMAYQSDPAFAEFGGPSPVAAKHMLTLLEMFMRWHEETPRENYQLTIIERASSSEPIGSCGVRRKGFEEGEAEFGIELAHPYWGRGLATEAGRAILEFGFRDLGLHTIVAQSVTENVRIARLLKKLGFRLVATRNGPEWIRDQGWSLAEWRLTADEWKSGVGG